MKIVGITGNSGSGKTTVCKILERLGAYIIDADVIARRVVEPGEPAYTELVDYFGAEILMSSGEINRKKLAGIAFSDEEKRQNLIAITHKHILRQMREDMANLAANPGQHSFIVMDAPLLIEAGLHGDCSQVWVVTADRALMRLRIIERDGLTAEQADARLAVQPTLEELKPYAHAVILNDGDAEGLERTVSALAEKLLYGGASSIQANAEDG